MVSVSPRGQRCACATPYYVTCTGSCAPATGDVTELRAPTIRPQGGWSSDGRKVKGTLHWVSAAHAKPAEVRLYDRLFTKENPSEGKGDFKDWLNPDSLEIIPDALIEPSLADFPVGERVQFERLGYFCVDPDSTPAKPVFNRSVALKDSWAKASR